MLTYFLTGLALGLVPFALLIGRSELYKRRVENYYRANFDRACGDVAQSITVHVNEMLAWRERSLSILKQAADEIDKKHPGHAYAKAVREQMAEGDKIEIKLPPGFMIVKGGKP